MRDKIEAYMKLLVGTDTTNPPGKEKALADQLIKLYQDCDYQSVSHGPDRESLVITLPGRNPEVVLGFAGHLDTVPIGSREHWKYEPFGEIVGDIMYGRGTTDMCGGLTAMLLLIDEYKRKQPPVTLQFIFTADEEADGTGANEIIDNGLFSQVKALIICEPTDLKLGISEKGSIWLKVTAHGVSSHAAMPEEGINALQLGMRFLDNMKESIEILTRQNPMLGFNTCQITGCQSGVKINIVPDEACFLVDIRTLPATVGGNGAVLGIIQELKEFYEVNYHLSLEVEVLNNREPIEQALGSQFIQRILKATTKHEDEVIGIYYYTDGAFMIPKTRIPFVIYGPGLPENCHKIDEHICLRQIEQCFLDYRQIIESYGTAGDAQ